MKESFRTCVICRKRDLKENLERFSFSDGKIVPDPTKLIGRGFYVHIEHDLEKIDLGVILRKRKK